MSLILLFTRKLAIDIRMYVLSETRLVILASKLSQKDKSTIDNLLEESNLESRDC